ncbi:MAG: Glycosyl hydrolase family 20, catalytic domain [bacterium ADurb.Bin429]|nr:MAG: Glycosyl hydrolase family 20, catalytic domain [bacterium ADurb.Bin429]
MLNLPYELPTYEIMRAQAPPALDGWLDSPCWHGARWVERFIAMETDEAIAKPTAAALTWDAECLYLGVKADEPRLAIMRADAEGGEGVAHDDGMVLHLNPGLPGVEYLVLAVNARGGVFLQQMIIDNPGWGTLYPLPAEVIRAGVQLTGTGWQAEVAIPFRALGVAAPDAGAEWHGNIGRDDKLDYDWSYWALNGDPKYTFGDWQLFPTLRFSPMPADLPTPVTTPPVWPETPRFALRGFMYDTSRGSQVFTTDYWINKLPFLRGLGFNAVIMYFENHLRFPSHPEFAPEGSWELGDLRRLQDAAAAYDIDIIPAQVSLGHAHGILASEAYRHLAEEGSDFMGAPYQLCPSHPGTKELLTDIFTELCKASRSPYISINADESAYLGLCPRCKETFAGMGKGDIFREHIKLLHEVITAHGKQVMMWDDMPWTYPKALDGFPRDIIMLDWHYSLHKRYPSVEVWRAMGFPVVACPGMYQAHNAFSLADEGARHGALGIINTLWEDHSLPLGSRWIHFLATSWAAHAPAPDSIADWYADAAEHFFGPKGRRLGIALAAELLAGRTTYPGARLSPVLQRNAGQQVITEAEALLAGGLSGDPKVLLEEFLYARRLLLLQADAKQAETPARKADIAARAEALKAEGLARWREQCTVPSQLPAFLERYMAIEQALAK